jgi:murein L,D-transpeptidase YcbB/YkuD
MQFQILENLKNLTNGIIHVDKLPDAIRMVSVGSRAFARAVMAFQAAYGLLVDGVCGPVTMAKILEEGEKEAKPKKKAKGKPQNKALLVDVEEASSSIEGGE